MRYEINQTTAIKLVFQTHLSIKAPSVYSTTASFTSPLLQMDVFLALNASLWARKKQVEHFIWEMLYLEGEHLMYSHFQQQPAAHSHSAITFTPAS